MPTYKITDPETGNIFETTREAPPSEQELEEIFTKMKQKPPEVSKKQSPAVQQKAKTDQSPVTREETRYDMAKAGQEQSESDDPQDVLLDVPTLKIDEIKLKVNDLDAKVTLSAALANLVKIDVGVHVSIADVDLDIKGVEAQALLKVRLKRVYEILARALETLDKNPEILNSVLPPLGKAIGEVGKGAGEAIGELGKDAGRAAGELESNAAPEVKQLGSETAKSLNPGGPIGETVKSAAGNAEQLTKGVTAQTGPAAESLKGKSEDVDKSIKGQFYEDEIERRYFHRKDKENDDDKAINKPLSESEYNPNE